MLEDRIAARAEVIDTIRALARDRRFAMKQQQKNDRSLEAWVRINYCAFSAFDDEKARKKASKEALAKIKAAREGEGDADLIEMVRANDAGRAPFDAIRKRCEKDMNKLAETLPGVEFVRSVKGAGVGGFALIVGECGDLAKYSGPGKVWKRLGLAPYDGHAGSTWRRETWRPRALTSDEWIAHPFSPARYSVMFTIADSMSRAQWVGKAKTEDGLGRPDGFFGEVYARRRAHTAITHPDWTLGHSRSDALRVMVKDYIKHLWVAWLNDDGVAVRVEAGPPMLMAAE